MSTITIYHNPKCGTSRNVLAMIRNAGIEPTVIEYLKTPPSRAELVALIAATGAPVRELIRAKEPIYAELKLADPALSDDALIDAMLAHPILMNRPLIVSARVFRRPGGSHRGDAAGHAPVPAVRGRAGPAACGAKGTVCQRGWRSRHRRTGSSRQSLTHRKA